MKSIVFLVHSSVKTASVSFINHSFRNFEYIVFVRKFQRSTKPSIAADEMIYSGKDENIK